ncbi:hypothetical protein EDB89DRAFT_1901963 [Lactarius sanguifluus]|nr:hypothetical protein EDB89DRAFT_1901963 [Lactarius sanguifluus]
MAPKPQETYAEIGSSTTPIPRERKKDQHVSDSGGCTKRNTANDCGEAATSTTSKRKDKPLHPEENLDDNWEDKAQPLNEESRQRLTRFQTLAVSSQNEKPRTSSSPTSNSHQNEVADDVPGAPNAIQEILNSAGLTPYSVSWETNEEASPSDGKNRNNIVKQLEQEIQHLKSRCN